MFELFVVGAVLLVLAAAFGLVWSVASAALWLVFLPFQLLRFVFKGLTLLFVLPLLVLVFGVVGLAVGVPIVLLIGLPLLPLFLLCAGVVWLVRRGARAV